MVLSRPAKYSYTPAPAPADNSMEALARFNVNNGAAFEDSQKANAARFFDLVKEHYGQPCNLAEAKGHVFSVSGPFDTETHANNDIESNAGMTEFFAQMQKKKFRRDTLDFE